MTLLRRLLGGEIGALVQKTGVAFVLQIGGAACAFGFSLVLTRHLGADEAGVYFLALTVASIAATLGRVGLDQALVRFAAAERERVGGLYRSAAWAVGLGTLAVSAALALGAPALGRLFGDPALTMPLQWMSAALLGINVAVFHTQLLKGIGRVREGVFADAFLRPALLLVGFGAVGAAYGVLGAIAAYAASALGAAGVAWALWRQRRPVGGGAFSTPLLLRTALPLYGVDVLLLIMQWAPTLLLGVWGTTADVALYSVAQRLVVLAAFVPTAVNTVVGPQLAAAHSVGDQGRVRRTVRRATALTLAMAGPLLAAYVVAPAWTMGWFGAEFREGAGALVLLSAGQLFNVAGGSAGQVLLMTGGERDVWWGMTLAVGAASVLGVALIGPYGLMGAAAAGAAALVLFNVYNVVAVRRRMGFWTAGWVP